MNKEIAIKVLNEVIQELNITTYEFSKTLGMKRPQGLYDILNVKKENVKISKNLADKICTAYPQFNLSWLLTGEGEMLKSNESNTDYFNNDLISRIKKVMSYYDLNTTQFAEKTGIGQANLSSMLNGNRVIGEGVINKIIISFDNISKDWLLTGQGNMIKNNYSQNIKDENVASENNSLYGVTRIVEPDNQTVPYFLYKDQLDENKRLTKEIARLELLLEQHGINPTKQIS